MPDLSPAPDWLTERPIAHRGLHDLTRGRAENSLAAFRAAVEAGYAIECDVQLAKGGEPVVFHDPDLKRMTGHPENVRDMTPAQLAKMKLRDTSDGIHLLSHHLEIVAGKVPLVVELKGVEGEDAGFVEGVARALAAYKGPVCVMSFDHWICAQFRSLMPNLPRGLTADGDENTHGSHRAAMRDYDLNFVSYGLRDMPNAFTDDMRKAGLPVISWTIKTPEQASRSAGVADQITFEGFEPGDEYWHHRRQGAHG